MNFSLAGKAAAITALLCSPAFGGIIYNPSTGWTGANPSGVWSYMQKAPGASAFSPLNYYVGGMSPGFSPFAGLPIDYWWNAEPMGTSRSVAHNQSGVPQTGWTITFPPGMLSLDSESGAISVRFTAPAASSYRVSGYFQHTDVVGLGVQVGILWNSMMPLMNQGPLVGPSQQMPFYFAPLSLNDGDTLDFTVSAIDTFLFLSTGLMLEVEQVPEPAGWQMGAIGVALLAVRRWRARVRA